MEEEFTGIQMEIYMMEIGKTGNNMEKDFYYIKVEIDFKVRLVSVYSKSAQIA